MEEPLGKSTETGKRVRYIYTYIERERERERERVREREGEGKKEREGERNLILERFGKNENGGTIREESGNGRE